MFLSEADVPCPALPVPPPGPVDDPFRPRVLDDPPPGVEVVGMEPVFVRKAFLSLDMVL